MRVFLVLFFGPALLGGLLGWGVRHLFRRLGWHRPWLPFAAFLCWAVLDTGSVLYVGTWPISGAEGWSDLTAVIIGAMMVSFGLAGLVVTALRLPKGEVLSPWAPPASSLRAALRAFLGFGLGQLLLSVPVFLLGTTLGFHHPGLPFPVYVVFLVLAYPLLGLALCRWLACEKSSPAGLLLWLALLLAVGLLMWSRSNSPNWGLSYVQSSVWGQIYGRLNFPVAVCLGDYQYAVPGSGLWPILTISLAPPALFAAGWLSARFLRQKPGHQNQD